MRLRRLSGVVVVLSVALLMAGCSRSAPPITDEQVEAWHALGEEMVPLAAEIEIEASEVTTMGGNSNWVDIVVSFADFNDLRRSDPAVTDFESAIKQQAPGTGVNTAVVNKSIGGFEAEVVARLLDNVPDVKGVRASFEAVYRDEGEPLSLWLTTYVYVDDAEAIDPTWLDGVAGHAQDVASDAAGQIYSIVVLPADVVELDLGDPEVEQAFISVQDLSTFEDSGADSGCVRTDSWVYDVSNDWVIVHPVDEPDGACA